VAMRSLNPLIHPRWDSFAAAHSKSSVFHQRAWLQALQDTYGYEPFFVFASGSDETLRDGFLFCEVKSRITGKRLVSLPFADHCEPLVSEPGSTQELIDMGRVPKAGTRMEVC